MVLPAYRAANGTVFQPAGRDAIVNKSGTTGRSRECAALRPFSGGER